MRIETLKKEWEEKKIVCKDLKPAWEKKKNCKYGGSKHKDEEKWMPEKIFVFVKNHLESSIFKPYLMKFSRICQDLLIQSDSDQ